MIVITQTITNTVTYCKLSDCIQNEGVVWLCIMSFLAGVAAIIILEVWLAR